MLYPANIDAFSLIQNFFHLKKSFFYSLYANPSQQRVDVG
jgi:hypothetical protein